MGKAILIPGADYSKGRAALKLAYIGPPRKIDPVVAYFGLKYKSGTGIITHPFAEGVDTAPIAGFSGQVANPALLTNVPALGLKECLFLRASSPVSRTLTANINAPTMKYTVHTVFANSGEGSVSVNAEKRLWSFIGLDGRNVSLDPFQSGNKMRISVTGSVRDLARVPVVEQKYIVSLVCDAIASTVTCYVDGVQDSIHTGVDMGPLIGTLYLGSTSNGSKHAHAYLGAMVIFAQADTPAEVAEYASFLSTAFS